MPNFQLFCGDSLDQLKNLPDNSVDSIVCDPPYGLSFMGKKWDYDVPSVDVWKECLRVLKPGGHLLAFAGTRTQHRMAVNIEDAGFEIRDMLAWTYGSGFPKSHNIANDIDKLKGKPARGKAIPTASTHLPSGKYAKEKLTGNKVEKYEARTEAGKPWAGWGTALKPALEPITLARKPVSEKTVARNVLKWRTGGINIDACRVGDIVDATFTQSTGRFPANLIHDGSEEIGDVFGEASRFFYCAKASKADREEGLEGGEGNRKNDHPTVKPTELMRYLCRLITPPGGTVLDPFMGSGSTGKAAMLEGFDFIGVDLSQEYVDIARARIEHARNKAEEKTRAEHSEKQKPKLF